MKKKSIPIGGGLSPWIRMDARAPSEPGGRRRVNRCITYIVVHKHTLTHKTRIRCVRGDHRLRQRAWAPCARADDEAEAATPLCASPALELDSLLYVIFTAADRNEEKQAPAVGCSAERPWQGRG